MNFRQLSALLFIIGLALLLGAMLETALPFGYSPLSIGDAITQRAVAETGSANIVTSILLAYRGLDTLGELTILFVAATAAGLVLGQALPGERKEAEHNAPAGFILRTAADLLFPFLLLLGAYIIFYGHISPGGGFQGGAILAAAFFIPLLASPAGPFNHRVSSLVESFAGASFILIGLLALFTDGYFLAPLFGTGTPGELFSAGSLPLLYLAVGLKVGSELAGLMAHLIDA